MTHEPMLEGITPAMIEAGIIAHAKWSEDINAGIGDLCIAIYTAMEAARTITSTAEEVTIAGNGPNTPAMMICAKLAEQGCAVPIALMEQVVAALTAKPSTEADVLREALVDAALEEAATICENAYGGSSSQVWNDSFARLLRDLKSTGRSKYKFAALNPSPALVRHD